MEEAKVEKSPYFSKQSFLGGLINRAKALRFPWSKNGKSYSNRLKIFNLNNYQEPRLPKLQIPLKKLVKRQKRVIKAQQLKKLLK